MINHNSNVLITEVMLDLVSTGMGDHLWASSV